ncbi:hypothetical protein [Shinella zoogloeoides]
MADRPILFSGPMVRAILDDRKTQTRRTLNPQPDDIIEGQIPARLRIAVGDRLWVRESWWIATMYSYGTTPGGCEIDPPPLAYRRRDPVHYAADGNPPNVGNRTYGPEGLRGGSFAAPDPYAVWLKKPSIHMPRWASRLTLTVTNVRVERLQDCSEADAIAEGIERHKSGWMPCSTAFYDGDGVTPANYHADPRISYMQLWDRINGRGAWDANPWVAAYTFTVERRNIDAPANDPKGGAE